MKINLKITAIIWVLLFSVTSDARLLNNMQSCQGVLAGVDSILAEAPPRYPKADVIKVREGFRAYSEFIQQKIVTPGLLEFSQGDQKKADEIQLQVDAYKTNMVNSFRKRYPENRIYMDHAVTINECTKQAVPEGETLEKLLTAFSLLQSLAELK